MLRFEMDVSAADTEQRTIEGMIAPYGEVGVINGAKYRFAPGSIRMRGGRTPLLLDHDRGRPVGVLAKLTDTPAGALASFKIDQTAAGDEALLQAASGSRGAFSVGASVEAADDKAGVIEVTAGLVHEVSLLALGAFDTATVHRVAAESDPAPDAEPEPEPELPATEPQPEQLPLPDPEPDPDRKDEPVTVEAAAPPVILAGADRQPRDLNAGQLVTKMIEAQHGDREALRYLEAVLAETISTDVTGLLPPIYEKTVIGGKSVPRVLYGLFGGRPLPGVGLAVNKPKWTTPPDGAWAANVDADATSTKVVIGGQSVNVERWDWAGAISWVVVQRSDPSIIDAIYAEAIQDFYLDVETKIAAELTAAAATDPATSIGAGIASFYLATDRNPEVIVVSPDVWGELADAGALENPVAAGGVSVGDGLKSSYAGLPIVASGQLAPASRYLATRRAIDARVTEPVRLTANAIGALNVELAVVGEAIFDTDYPGEVMALTAPTIP